MSIIASKGGTTWYEDLQLINGHNNIYYHIYYILSYNLLTTSMGFVSQRKSSVMN